MYSLSLYQNNTIKLDYTIDYSSLNTKKRLVSFLKGLSFNEIGGIY